MPTKTHAINFGNAIVESTLACSPMSSGDTNTKENQKQLIKKYMIDFKVEDLFDVFESVIKTNINDILVEMVNLIQSIRQRMIIVDENDEHLGDYFFLSASINFIDISMLSITLIPDKENTLKPLSYALFEPAVKVSVKLGIKYPRFSKSGYMKSNTTVIQNEVKIWLNDLRKLSNNKEPKKPDNLTKWSIIIGIILALVTIIYYIIDVYFQTEK